MVSQQKEIISSFKDITQNNTWFPENMVFLRTFRHARWGVTRSNKS